MADKGHMMHGGGFEFSHHVTLFLPIFDVDSPQGLFLVGCIFTVLTMSYEGIKCLRLTISEQSGNRWNGIPQFSKSHLLQTFMFVLEFVIGYLIMLTVMTYNAWLFISVVLGSVIGYFLCSYINLRHRFRIMSSSEAETRVRKRTDETKHLEEENVEMLTKTGRN